MASSAQALPTRFPIFPLGGALLLPSGNLPLNIFEPRYLAMVRDAMRTDRIIGMIQPKREADDRRPEIYETGCVGRIANLEEAPNGRFLIVLTGVCRFDVVKELDVDTPYRQVTASFERWRHDLEPSEPSEPVRAQLLQALQRYFDKHGVNVDWTAIRQAPIAALVVSLAMICPFQPTEKQALLEAPDLTAQARLLVTLMEMAAMADTRSSPVCH